MLVEDIVFVEDELSITAKNEMGETIGYCYRADESHNGLRVLSSVTENRGKIAGLLLDRMEEKLGRLETEKIRGYDLLWFYIKRGWVPTKRGDSDHYDLNSIKTEIADYYCQGRNKPINDPMQPTTKLKYEPTAARKLELEIRGLIAQQKQQQDIINPVQQPEVPPIISQHF